MSRFKKFCSAKRKPTLRQLNMYVEAQNFVWWHVYGLWLKRAQTNRLHGEYWN